ncbi:MocR-like pyridoxine biosynthesis transcription factor PdxR [Algicola sagamiensis]|uniref:MocR-like pyridoxine biosynthesis transcription factor PdxR n=1 Tax=Algicola sagamiensis TaxID=163869 RepID=UPI00036B3A2F|nr:PLP-dependent aminotransferase family protein [Algicola sagamiensis]
MILCELSQLQLSGRGTKYQQLYEALRQGILAGTAPKGSRLPGSRELAKELGLGRNTVMSAIEQLKAEGYIRAQQGSGYYICSELPEQLATPDFVIEEIEEDLEEGTPGKSRRNIAFQLGVPKLAAFPVKIWQRIQNRHQGRPALMGMDEEAGYLPFREILAEYLVHSRQVSCHAKNIIITCGAQEALFIAARAVLKPGEKALIEDPGYRRLRNAFHLTHANIVGVPANEETGLCLTALKTHPDAKVLYTTPAHQYPLGGIMPLDSRVELLTWAKENDVWVIEDDYDSEFQYRHRPFASLQGLNQGQQVLYVGSFSKVTFPALRLGYLVVPDELIDVCRFIKASTSGETPLLTQATMADFIEEGHFARHLRRMRQHYQKLHDSVRQQVDELLPDSCQLLAKDAGMHLVITWLHDVSGYDAAAYLQKKGYGAAPLEYYYLNEPAMKGLVIGFANTREDKIGYGLNHLADFLSQISHK